MAAVRELSARYERFLVTPRRGDGVCEQCFNLTQGYRRCYACARTPQHLDAMAPISYSIATEELHHALAAYKRTTGPPAVHLQAELAAVLWRFVAAHERCLAAAAGAPGFELAVTVPSGDRERDAAHPLSRLVSELIAPVKGRFERVLVPAALQVAPHQFSEGRFVATKSLSGESILLIDDTWTTGASAQSAAATLKRAGAGRVAVLVIGRHVNRAWGENDARLRALATGFDWRACALCLSRGGGADIDPLAAYPASMA